jgi:hypothetical protein
LCPLNRRKFIHSTSNPETPPGERVLQELQLEAARRVPQRRDLILAQGATDIGRTLACSLQHDPCALLARLPIASAGDVAPRTQNRVGRSGKQSTLPTSPHPRRRRYIDKTRCATRTIQPVQKIGRAHLYRSDASVSGEGPPARASRKKGNSHSDCVSSRCLRRSKQGT